MNARLVLAAFAIAATSIAHAQSCARHLFVSGYFSNNVAIFDACDGRFLRQLDGAGRIRGAQAVRLNPADDLIYVVSEINGQVQRYRHDARYAFVDVFAQFTPEIDPTGIAFGADGRVFVASYGTSRVLELDRATGQVIGIALPGDSGLLGADNGLMMSGAGVLYVPGYSSASVARVNPATGEVRAAFVPARAQGLRRTRGIVDEGATILVGGEGSGEIYRFDADTGAFVGKAVTGLGLPTGLALDADGSILVLSGTSVIRFDRASGARLGVLASTNAGAIDGGTFIALIPVVGASGSMPITSGFTGTWVDAGVTGQLGLGLEVLPDDRLVAEIYTFAPLGGQAWIGGVGPIDGDHATVTLSTIDGPGGRFGAAFDPARVQNTTWGSATLRFSDCNHGTLDWDSDVPGYGSGSMELVRVTMPSGLACP
ncbi:MAG: Vgb family protein [Dokdonella sp.]|uniref:Vgb family protein n=1 Tax=Dokdonella sp. TaxID=2291710 RepID=UPI003F7E8EB2